MVITALLVPTGIIWQNVILPTICDVSRDDRRNIVRLSFDTEYVSVVETLNRLKSLKALRHLFDLDLSGTTITDAGLEHLKAATDLQFLDTSRTQVTGAGLADLKGLTNLIYLSLYDTQVTDAGLVLTKLEKALPKVRVFGVGGR